MNKNKKKTLYKPFKAPAKSKYKMKVYIKDKNGRTKLIGFGLKGYRHNYSKKAKKSYCARSAGIKSKGKLTKNNKNKANYWARTVLWNC